VNGCGRQRFENCSLWASSDDIFLPNSNSNKVVLKEIIVDDPQLETTKSKIDYYSMAYGALRLAITEGGIDVRIKKRKCPDHCGCLDVYQSDSDKSEAMFFPKI
jgi:hypothetical protein